MPSTLTTSTYRSQTRSRRDPASGTPRTRMDLLLQSSERPRNLMRALSPLWQRCTKPGDARPGCYGAADVRRGARAGEHIAHRGDAVGARGGSKPEDFFNMSSRLVRSEDAIKRRTIVELFDQPSDTYHRVCRICGSEISALILRPTANGSAGSEVIRCANGHHCSHWNVVPK